MSIYKSEEEEDFQTKFNHKKMKNNNLISKVEQLTEKYKNVNDLRDTILMEAREAALRKEKERNKFLKMNKDKLKRIEEFKSLEKEKQEQEFENKRNEYLENMKVHQKINNEKLKLRKQNLIDNMNKKIQIRK